MNSNLTKKKWFWNYQVRYDLPVLFLILITWIFSQFFTLPLVQAQGLHSYISSWAAYGTRDGKVSQPTGIALDQEDRVYVADTANNRIQVFSSNGTFISKWGGAGPAELWLRSPTEIAVHQ